MFLSNLHILSNKNLNCKIYHKTHKIWRIKYPLCSFKWKRPAPAYIVRYNHNYILIRQLIFCNHSALPTVFFFFTQKSFYYTRIYIDLYLLLMIKETQRFGFEILRHSFKKKKEEVRTNAYLKLFWFNNHHSCWQ